MNTITLYLVLILAIIQNGNSLTTGKSENESSEVNRQLDQQCVPHTYGVIKPLLDYVGQVKEDIEKSQLKDEEIRELNGKLFHQEGNERIIKELKNQISYQQKTIDSLIANSKPTDSCDRVTKELTDCTVKLEECENQFGTLNDSLLQKDNEIISLNLKIKELIISNLQFRENEEKLLNKAKDLQLNQTKVDDIPDSCIPFGNSPGVHKIALPGMDAFDVLCDSHTVGPGWLVILQFIRNQKDFYGDWATYREGFGVFDGDYFLGLEKIHRLTNSRRYELFILDFPENYLRYDNFVVANEKDDYTLSNLGNLSMGKSNVLKRSEHQKFSTFDRDNDMNCANRTGGWWYADCYNILFKHFLFGDRFMMLMRPKE